MADTSVAHLFTAAHLQAVDKNAIEAFEAKFIINYSPDARHVFTTGLCFGNFDTEYGSARGIHKRGGFACLLVREDSGAMMLNIYSDAVRRMSFPIEEEQESLEVELKWVSGNGLQVKYAGLRHRLRLEGFAPGKQDHFAFTCSTGKIGAEVEIEPILIKTTPSQPVATGLIIAEFMASNKDTIKDEDFESSDWLEIYNGSDQIADLTGWFLTDDRKQLKKWSFSRHKIAPFGRLFLFASGKNRKEPNSVFHTNFKLSKAGGDIVLSDPDGRPVARVEGYPPQVTDIAYGEAARGAGTGYLATPTPMQANSAQVADAPPVDVSVVFSSHPGLFQKPFDLTLTMSGTLTPDAEIRYTTDGSLPRPDSKSYRTPIRIDTDTIVRSAVFAPGHLFGAVSTKSYTRLGKDLTGFGSNLPIVVVEPHGRDIDGYFSPRQPRPFQPVGLTLFEPGSGDSPQQARLAGKPVLQKRAGLHVRGHSSAHFPKKSYALEFWDERDEDMDAEPLSFPKHSDFVLYAPYADKSLIRNKLAYDLARQIGGDHAGVRSRFVELFHNANGGGLTMADYCGVYLFCERISRGKSRVPVERLNPFVNSPAMLRGGYIFKRDDLPSGATFTTPIEKQRLEFVYPKRPNDVQRQFLEDHVANFEKTLHGDLFTSPEDGYRAFIDINSFILNHLMIEVSRNADAYGRSSYFHKTRNGTISALPIWDYNLAFGNADFGSSPPAEGWRWKDIEAKEAQSAGARSYFWYPRLFQDPVFSERYKERYRQLRDGALSTENLFRLIDGYASELAESGARNFSRWPILGKNIWPHAQGGENRITHEIEIDYLRRWIKQRMEWIDAYL